MISSADPGFSWGGANSQSGYANLFFAEKLHEKWKNGLLLARHNSLNLFSSVAKMSLTSEYTEIDSYLQ